MRRFFAPDISEVRARVVFSDLRRGSFHATSAFPLAHGGPHLRDAEKAAPDTPRPGKPSQFFQLAHSATILATLRLRLVSSGALGENRRPARRCGEKDGECVVGIQPELQCFDQIALSRRLSTASCRISSSVRPESSSV